MYEEMDISHSVDPVIKAVGVALQTHQLGELSAVAISSDGHPPEHFVDLGQFGVVELDLSKVLDNVKWLGRRDSARW